VVYGSYLSVVTGLSPIALGIVGVFLAGLLFLNVKLIRKSNNKMLGIFGLLLFWIASSVGLVVFKKWDVDKNQVRRYQQLKDK
jgi:hypothetical protein